MLRRQGTEKGAGSPRRDRTALDLCELAFKLSQEQNHISLCDEIIMIHTEIMITVREKVDVSLQSVESRYESPS
jgi:hypothetical protein